MISERIVSRQSREKSFRVEELVERKKERVREKTELKKNTMEHILALDRHTLSAS